MPEAPQPESPEVKRLAEQLQQLRSEYERARKAEAEQAKRQQEMQRTLKAALEANRRQLHEIAKVHDAFLPRSFDILGGLEVAAHCRPCHDMGGDFYAAEELPDGRIAICIADVAGHGAQAAVAMATTRALLRVAFHEIQDHQGPSDVLLRLAVLFRDLLTVEQFVTMWLGIYSPERGELRFASAAHPPAVLWPASGEPQFLEIEPALPLGIAGIEPRRGPERSIDFDLGDRVFLYTDGWNESPSSTGETLSGERFLDFLANAYGQPVSMVPAVLFMEFERHAANSRISDDVTLLVFDRVI